MYYYYSFSSKYLENNIRDFLDHRAGVCNKAGVWIDRRKVKNRKGFYKPFLAKKSGKGMIRKHTAA